MPLLFAVGVLTANIRLRVKLAELDSGQWLPTWFAMFGHHIGENAATHIKLGGQTHEFGVCGGDQIVQNAIGHGFMETALIAERPHIQLETLQLHALLIGDVIQIQHSKIGLAGFGAQAGKFRDFHMDMKIAAWLRVVKGFECFRGLTRHKGYRIN